MAINRAPFNALVDDDGSNLLGTPWNKAAIAGVILDPVDAALGASSSRATVIAAGVTGTLHDWAMPGRTANTILEWTGAGQVYFTGIAAGVMGDVLTFKNMSPTQVMYFGHQTSSAAANQFFLLVGSAATPVAPYGWMSVYYNGTKWILVDYDQGSPITAAYSQAYFHSGAGVWTVDAGDMQALNFVLRGRTLTVSFSIAASSLSVSNNLLLILNTGWGNFLASSQKVAWCFAQDNGTTENGMCQVAPAAYGTDRIAIFRAATLPWAVQTNALGCYATIEFGVL